jgi:pimeloyl-ACP methyl ester carboxylesterase
MQKEEEITSGEYRLAATLFGPDGAAKGAVLFVPPFVEERKGALPVIVQAAREWAGRGTASLFFDYAGTGDSSGDFEDVPPEQFSRDVETALAYLRQECPGVPVAVVGVRAGCSLAAETAARHDGDIAALVEWAPVAGEEFLKQLLQRRMVNDMVAYGKARESRADLERRLMADEAVDLDGYTFSGALFRWMKGLAIVMCATPTLVPDMRIPPFWNTVGHVDMAPLIAATEAWLAPRLAMAAGAAAPEAAGRVVRMAFDWPTGKPTGGALFLHGWSGDRTGPHRLFTKFARQLAGRGILSVRPDFIGRGLSDGAASDAAIATMAGNAGEALAKLKAQLPAGAPVTVVAICSGCKVAITLAAAHPEIDRLVLWSAESMGSLRAASTGLRKMLNMLRAYAGKLTKPETWKKILGGRVNTSLVTKALVRQEKRSPEEAKAEDETLKKFRAFRHPVFFVFGGSDPDAPGSSAAYARFCKKWGIPFAMHTVPNAGHSYYGAEWTRELLEETVRNG